MRLILLLVFLGLFGCNTSGPNNNNSEKDTTDISIEPPKDSDTHNVNPASRSDCTSSDFLKLKDQEIQSRFFRQLDSVRKVQYPGNDQDIHNLVDMTPALLNQFLKDINSDSLQRNNTYEADYFFNIAPPGYTDTKKCDDKISILFFPEDCSFRIIVDNVYPVEEMGCAGGAQVIYGFKIIDNKIVDFGRQAAG